ncbi:helix-turn-helix domain-containing protein [Jiella sp. MQZ9-1]|uniref:Helix-turn-helix transcriptional regulator n=1 Tax=Jiella flava TaxID=2816857 RepID=A0A939FVD0_9HYPH|nr:helix-turn-helix transcriptional regulator [Jiella flava]MCD2470128.1 helix-turn-helix domain-containing protein [Jiella flava]
MSPSSLGRALRRWRRLNDIKQTAIAETLRVSQTTVSRWESGQGKMSDREMATLVRMVGAQPDSDSDRALLDLVAGAAEPMHLVCDLSHRLLAASPARMAAWRVGLETLRGRSLWRFASADIMRAEAALAGSGWHEAGSGEFAFQTRFHDCETLWIGAGTIIWTRIPLSNGTMARLVRDGARAAE